MTKIAHIVNPVFFTKSSSHDFAQQIAISTMKLAKALADIDTELEYISVQYPEDHPVIPDFAKYKLDLNRSILDVGNFKKPRKLPLIKDIFDLAFGATDAEYLIYTNMDICLMPFFYQVIEKLIHQGYDAFTINRRTISGDHKSLDSLPLMFADIGEPHRGWDCFIFKRSNYPNFILGNICLGVPMVGLAMVANLIAFSKNFQQVTQAHLTFHIGNDRAWNDRSNIDYDMHNRREILKNLCEISEITGGFDPKSPPGSYLKFHQNKVIAYIYDSVFMRFYIPAKYTRSRRGKRL